MSTPAGEFRLGVLEILLSTNASQEWLQMARALEQPEEVAGADVRLDDDILTSLFKLR